MDVDGVLSLLAWQNHLSMSSVKLLKSLAEEGCRVLVQESFDLCDKSKVSVANKSLRVIFEFHKTFGAWDKSKQFLEKNNIVAEAKVCLL